MGSCYTAYTNQCICCFMLSIFIDINHRTFPVLLNCFSSKGRSRGLHGFRSPNLWHVQLLSGYILNVLLFHAMFLVYDALIAPICFYFAPCWWWCLLTSSQVSWCKFEVTVDSPKDISVLMTSTTLEVPPVVVAAVNLKTIINEKHNVHEIVSASVICCHHVKVSIFFICTWSTLL